MARRGERSCEIVRVGNRGGWREGGRKGVKCRPGFGARVRRGGRGDYKPRKTIAASVIE